MMTTRDMDVKIPVRYMDVKIPVVLFNLNQTHNFTISFELLTLETPISLRYQDTINI